MILKPKRQRTSKIWQYSRTSQNGDLLFDKDGDTVWICKNCSKTYKEKSGTTKPAKHLVKCLQTQAEIIEQNDDEHQDQQALQSYSLGKLDSDRLEELYLSWVTSHSVPEEQVCWPEFRDFLDYVSPTANALLPVDHRKFRVSLISNRENECTAAVEETEE
jgi:hypothetical protein